MMRWLCNRDHEDPPPHTGVVGSTPERWKGGDNTMAAGRLTVYIPDQNAFEIPDNGQSIEEIRRGLIGAGYTQLETAVGRKTGSEVRFERPQGGDKGSR